MFVNMMTMAKSSLELTRVPRASAVSLAAWCAPLVEGSLTQDEAEILAPLLKALADPVRLRLMSMLASRGDEVCVCDLNDAFDLSQPTISHHLKVLHQAGLVDREKRGVWVYYRARLDALSDLAAVIRGPASS
jgi:ArsR family transcriptional regulator